MGSAGVHVTKNGAPPETLRASVKHQSSITANVFGVVVVGTIWNVVLLALGVQRAAGTVNKKPSNFGRISKLRVSP